MLERASIEVPFKRSMIKGGHRLHWRRRGLQSAFILALVAIPLSGLFRIDPLAGAFVVLDRQIWFSDFFLVFGLWMMLSCGLVVLYSLVGTAFCGWACPQNSLSEWANHLTKKWLGRKAKVDLDGAAPQVASRKNKTVNWFILGGLFMLTAMVFALIPLVYFYTPGQIWGFVTLQPDPVLGGSWYWIYTVFVLILFLDIAFIRHFWCRFMCIYKVWQHTFRTKQTLKLHYDSSRSADCEKCNYCVQACFLELDPRQTDVYDSCVNCGACVVACDKIHSKKGGKGLLSLHFGDGVKVSKGRWLQGQLTSLLSRVHWTLPIAALGLLFFILGVVNYQSFSASVYRADGMQTGGIQTYTVNIANKLYQPGHFQIQVNGLAADAYQLSQQQLDFQSVGRKNIELQVADDLKPGVYPFQVIVIGENGNRKVLQAMHLAGKGHG